LVRNLSADGVLRGPSCGEVVDPMNPAPILLLLAVPAQAAAEDGRADEKARATEFLRIATNEAKAYTFHPVAHEHELLLLHPDPILRWTNPIVGSVSGGFYLWTARGRPEVVASIYKWHYPVRPREHEFQSLSLGRFVAKRDGQADWMPARPGVELKPVPDSPPPAGTPAQRLRQIRDLVKGFSASNTDHKGVERDLRLLTQPLYRYEGTEGDLVDGGLFVFVIGTDPEVIVLIEAHQDGNARRWLYALARMTHAQLQVSYRGREVWKVPLLDPSVVNDHREPYTKFRFQDVESAAQPIAP
jgi:hypothetical protein